MATSAAPTLAPPPNIAQNFLAVATLGVLAVMVLPLPSFLLDILLAISIAISVVVFLFSLNITKPLEFSAFPSLLLLVTLMRLALNVATTRLILLNGSKGPDAAGHVIATFGQFVVGGNLAVGVIVFVILIIINFVVITKGAGRIAEVGARFTLDALPGKQMAIDSDLAAGLITEDEARLRRRTVEQEADFFGSMDGASKFVRGDAIAGLVITAVNIVGGLFIGVVQGGMTVSEAASTYATLSIGDGLVTQIPALLTSIAAGLVTTRASAGGSLGGRMNEQMLGAKQPLQLAAGLLGALALVPGMPHFAFILLSAGLFFVARRKTSPIAEAPVVKTTPASHERAELEAELPMELLDLEVGFELVPLVDAKSDGSLLRRIAGVRKQLALDLGIVVPPVHVRDNLRLRGGEYRLLLSGAEVGRGEIRVGRLLAMSPSSVPASLPGETTKEPAFGLPAKWIVPADRERAERMSLTVVDAATVLATHLGELLQENAEVLLGRRELQELLEVHGRSHSKVLEELVPGLLSHGQVIKVLRGLLRERVSVRDMRTILESLADSAAETKDIEVLIESARQRLGRQIVAKHLLPNGSLPVLLLSPSIENFFRRLQQPGATLETLDAKNVVAAFESATEGAKQMEDAPVILTSGETRRAVATFCKRHVPGFAVLSYRELDAHVTLKTVAMVGNTNPVNVGPERASSASARA